MSNGTLKYGDLRKVALEALRLALGLLEVANGKPDGDVVPDEVAQKLPDEQQYQATLLGRPAGKVCWRS